MKDLYQHYKGGLYRLLHEATEEATMQPVIVYQAVDGGRIWTRPKADFFGTVHNEKLGGTAERIPRFRFVGKEAPAP